MASSCVLAARSLASRSSCICDEGRVARPPILLQAHADANEVQGGGRQEATAFRCSALLKDKRVVFATFGAE